jgi:magnesium transporter
MQNLRYLELKDIPKLASVIEKLYLTKKYSILRNVLAKYYPADIEIALREMEDSLVAGILKVANPKIFVNIFQYLDLELQIALISYFKDYELKFLFENLPDDERTSILHELPTEKKDKIFALLSEKERAIATNFLSYEEDSAASIAISHYAYTYEDLTVEETLKLLREFSVKFENIYTIYVLNQEGVLVATLSLERLLFSHPHELIVDLAVFDFITIKTDDDKEKAGELIAKYDLMTLPVVDEENHLIGIITYDDVMDMLVQQGTEDFQRFAGVTKHDGVQESYFKQSTWLKARRRLTWTIIPVLMEIFTGFIVTNGEHVLEKFFLLATYMPMVTSAGGDIGSQSASIVIRSLSLKEIGLKDTLMVLRKELGVSFIIAFFVSSIIAIKMVLLPHPPVPSAFWLVIVSVSLAMGIQLISAALFGSIIPMIAMFFKIDPAIMSSPVLSSLVDITGMFIFFETAKLILF